MKDLAEEMRLLAKKQQTEEEEREEIKRFGEQKKDQFWKKLNNDIGKEVKENLIKILRRIKIEAERGKKETLFNIGEERKNRYVTGDSKMILNEICDRQVKHLDTGRNMNIGYCFDSVFENNDMKLNLLAEKLTDLIKKEGFEAEKSLREYTQDLGWEDIKGQSVTWHLFDIKISW